MGGTKEWEGHNNGRKLSKYMCKWTKLSQLSYKMTHHWGSRGNATGSTHCCCIVFSSKSMRASIFIYDFVNVFRQRLSPWLMLSVILFSMLL